jgi:minichromosome maintenance protein 10
MTHTQVQNQLADRYILSPSQIYSIMRLSSDKQQYTIPVDAGWVVIGVVCHKGEIKVTQGKKKKDDKGKGKGRASEEEGDMNGEDGDESGADGKRQKNGQGAGEWTSKKKKPGKNAPASKFITIKICSLPSRSQLSGSSSSSQGDAIMNVMLFEADSDETLPPSYPGEPVQRQYRGGSGGAFEVWWKLAVGTVVGIINPRILKPFGVSSGSLGLGFVLR